MQNQTMDFSVAHRECFEALHGFVNNPDTPDCVVVSAKGIGVSGERCLGGLAGISHKPVFNCGF